jgi:uncharacterized protein YecE (DUF72 family)
MEAATVRVGTAGWTVPAPVRGRFAGEGSQLERYATRFSCVEVNSTFYRPHRVSTYARWAVSVPPDFRFALKLPKTITHERRLIDATEPLEAFLDQSAPLGAKRAVILVQLPPSLAYDESVARAFFEAVRTRYDGLVACEPRHPTWFFPAAEDALRGACVARVAADPAVVPEAATPGGWDGFAYVRLHGAPRAYYSSYDGETLDAVAARLRSGPRPAWCIFDNTALGAAAANALDLTDLLAESRRAAGDRP